MESQHTLVDAIWQHETVCGAPPLGQGRVSRINCGSPNAQRPLDGLCWIEARPVCRRLDAARRLLMLNDRPYKGKPLGF
jgi:hypothetical protein